MMPLHVLAALAMSTEGGFLEVDNCNAVPTGTDTTQTSFEACQSTCVGACLQFSFNTNSGHCFLSNTTTFKCEYSGHVNSGCLVNNVTGCALPTPAPPTPPTPAPPPTPPTGPFGSPWFANRLATNLSAAGPVLTWAAMAKPDCVLTHLPKPLDLSKDGAVASVRMAWMSDGADSCPPSDWAGHGYCRNDEPCLHTSIHCLAGTGDFRIGILDSNGAGYVNASGWADTTSYSGVDKALSSPPFNQYLGYSFRIDPHVSTKAEHYVPKASGSTAVPCSFNWNGLKHAGHALSKERLGYNGCFQAPTGGANQSVWTDLIMEVHRVSKSEAKIKMQMGSVSYSLTHKITSAEESRFPRKIDTVLIEYPNSRKYSYVKMAPHT